MKSIKFLMKLKINFIEGKSNWQQAQLIPDFQRQDCINSHGDGGGINPVLMTLKINFNNYKKLAENPNVLQLLVDGDNQVPVEKFSGLCFVWKISSMMQMPLSKGCYSNKGQYLHLQAQQMYFSLWQC